MAFVLVFILGTFAIPLAIEIYRHGGNNVVTRSVREVRESKFGVQIVVGFAAASRRLGDLAAGAVVLLVGIVVIALAAWVVLPLAFWILLAFIGLIARILFGGG
jgi:hypothetical protein